jgi:serine/threonine protein kinase
MITLSCRHCGQPMKVKDEDGTKKAHCPRCGQVVSIAGAKVGKRGRGSPTSSTGSGERTVVLKPPIPDPMPTTAPVPNLEAGSETGSAPPIHEIPTRAEEAGADRSLTSFLAPPQAPDEIGRLGSYRVLEVVGAGGMGVVYKAEDPQLQRLVALKAMLPSLAASTTARERFLREARAAAAIEHDRIVAIYQVGDDRGVPWLAMPFLKGESLDSRLRRAQGPLPLAELLQIALQIAEGLAAIHDLGLIHRDIKPGNIWLESRHPLQASPPARSGEGGERQPLAPPLRVGEGAGLRGEEVRVKILDFGLARANQDTQLTQEGSIVGSPAFMAPEQAGRKPVDARADLFSLGCVLYLMATGSLPFEGEDALTTLLAITCHEPTPPQQRNPSLSAGVSELILALLQKKPEDRPASARVVIELLRKLMC